jgi:hypothetical protein
MAFKLVNWQDPNTKATYAEVYATQRNVISYHFDKQAVVDVEVYASEAAYRSGARSLAQFPHIAKGADYEKISGKSAKLPPPPAEGPDPYADLRNPKGNYAKAKSASAVDMGYGFLWGLAPYKNGVEV